MDPQNPQTAQRLLSTRARRPDMLHLFGGRIGILILKQKLSLYESIIFYFRAMLQK